MSKCKASCSSLSQSGVPFVHGKKDNLFLQVPFQVKEQHQDFEHLHELNLKKIIFIINNEGNREGFILHGYTG